MTRGRVPPAPAPQDDYHKLLTKYAEAENTIDQLRLGAKVGAGWDPGGHVGVALPEGTRGSGSGAAAQRLPCGPRAFLPQPRSSSRRSCG